MTNEILIGDCRETLKTIPDGSVHCCVTRSSKASASLVRFHRAQFSVQRAHLGDGVSGHSCCMCRAKVFSCWGICCSHSLDFQNHHGLFTLQYEEWQAVSKKSHGEVFGDTATESRRAFGVRRRIFSVSDSKPATDGAKRLLGAKRKRHPQNKSRRRTFRLEFLAAFNAPLSINQTR